MAEPPIKRYALVPKAGDDGIRRFRLARVGAGPARAADRLERMDEIALGDLADFTPPRASETDDPER